MRLETRSTIHAGVNFIVAPFQPTLDRESCLRFQASLEENDIPISHVDYEERTLVISRETPAPLQIKIGIVGPQIGQLLIIAPSLGGRSLGVFGVEAEDISKVFTETYFTQQFQVLSCDVTLRDLYETDSDHAFKELWENRLHQSQDGLKSLKRTVLGGGLRFVMPHDEENPLIEVKIESYLQNTRKLFLEAQFSWPVPEMPVNSLDPERRITIVDDYMRGELANFVQEGQTL